jgi:hypothetical protein
VNECVWCVSDTFSYFKDPIHPLSTIFHMQTEFIFFPFFLNKKIVVIMSQLIFFTMGRVVWRQPKGNVV